LGGLSGGGKGQKPEKKGPGETGLGEEERRVMSLKNKQRGIKGGGFQNYSEAGY